MAAIFVSLVSSRTCYGTLVRLDFYGDNFYLQILQRLILVSTYTWPNWRLKLFDVLFYRISGFLFLIF